MIAGRRIAAVALAGVAALGGIAACGGDDEDRPPKVEAPDTAPGTGSGRAADTYLGLTKQAAIDRAAAAGIPWRITREDDEELLVTQDYVPERLNFEIDDGVVTTVSYG